MPEPALLEQKKSLRRTVRAAAADFYPRHGAASSREIFTRLISLPEYQACRTLFCFVGTGHEADTFLLLRHALQHGRRVAVPLCTGPGRMEARLIPDLDALSARGAYGIPEPAPDAPRIALQEIDFAVVPCLCCDRKGHRLGHGGGYYDRCLEHALFPWTVVCPEALLVPAVPVEPWDVTAPIVVTDHGVYRT